MRRPQTKQPYSYHYHAVRHRGRPVHRIYRATPRPPMHGRIIVMAAADPSFAFIITFKQANFETRWWVVGGTESFCVDRANQMLSSPTPGRIYNEFNYGLSTGTFFDWADLYDSPFIEFCLFEVTGDPPAPYIIDTTF